jgi:hypothetical protein
MKRLLLLLHLLLSLLVLGTVARGQEPKVTIVGTEPMTLADFNLARTKIQQALGSDSNIVPGWHVRVLSEDDWNDMRARIAKNYIPAQHAFTDMDHRVSYVREKYILRASIDELRFTLLHEAGHLYYRTSSESKADAFSEAHH